MTFQPGIASVPSPSVELTLSGDNLRNLDLMSKSDPFCVLYVNAASTGAWRCIDRTETIDNTLEPHWQKKFILQYKFEERQMLR